MKPPLLPTKILSPLTFPMGSVDSHAHRLMGHTQLCLEPTAAHSPEGGRRGSSQGPLVQHLTGSQELAWGERRDATLADGNPQEQILSLGWEARES